MIIIYKLLKNKNIQLFMLQFIYNLMQFEMH